jgi:peptidyl-prolyl cis-trans isomerase C
MRYAQTKYEFERRGSALTEDLPMFGRLTGAGVAFLVALLLLQPAGAQSVRDRLEKDVVVAVVEGEQIMSSELIGAFQSLPPKVRQRGLRSVYPRLLEQIIEERLLTIHGRLNNLADDPEVKARVRRAEDSIVGQVYLNRLVKQSLTDEALRKRYDDLAKNTKTAPEVRARHILLKSEADAKKVIKLINGGKRFEDIAKTHSTGPSGPQGGDLGYFRRGDMVKPFADAAFAMQAGQVTQIPVKTEFGWHVIKVEDKRDSKLPPFERVRGRIARDLARRFTADILNQARESATIERFSLEGEALPAPVRTPKK